MKLRLLVTAALGTAIAATALWASTPRLQTLPDGIWRTAGYGYVFRLQGEKLAIFDETGNACLLNGILEGAGARDWSGNAAVAADGMHAILHAGISRVGVSRLMALPQNCRATEEDHAPLANFDVLWETFSEHYAFFRIRNVDWNALRAEFRPQAAAARSPEQLFAVLSAMLSRLKDAHVSLTTGENEFKVERSPEQTAPGLDRIVPTRKGMQRALKDYISGSGTPLLKPAQPLGRNRVWYGELKGKIGYVAIFAMGGFAEDNISAEDHTRSAHTAFQELARAFRDMKGVIVDLRYNQGGYDTVSLELAALYAERPGMAFRKRAHGTADPAYGVPLAPAEPVRLPLPVAVLISEHTVSAGETAATAFRSLPNATLIGQSTQGALSDVLEKVLPNGWRFTLSNEVFETMDGLVPEGVGVKPNIETRAPTAPKTPRERFQPDIDEAVRALASR